MRLLYAYTKPKMPHNNQWRTKVSGLQDPHDNSNLFVNLPGIKYHRAASLGAPGSLVGRAPKPALGTWWWGRIPPNQPYPKGAVPAATTLLKE